jgi:hypothetical protein
MAWSLALVALILLCVAAVSQRLSGKHLLVLAGKIPVFSAPEFLELLADHG